MKKLIVGFLVLFFLVSVPVHATTHTGHLVVLMYHRFDAGGAISTPMDQFRREIQYLKDNNYNFVSLDEVIDHLRSGDPFPEKSVLISVDDGYESTYTHAYPYLKEQNIPWVLYVYTRAIEEQYSSSLSWEQIKEMARNGVDVENHTYSHGHPIRKDFREGNWVKREIRNPHQLIEKKTGQAVRSFALPYGEYDTKLIDTLKDKMNYDVVWGIDPGVVDPSSSSSVLPRFGINGSTNHGEFEEKLQRLPLGVNRAIPEPGGRIRGGDTLSIELSRPERYNRGQINLFVSGRGVQESNLSDDGETLLSQVPRNFKDPWTRIILTAYDSKYERYRYFSRGFVTDFESDS